MPEPKRSENKNRYKRPVIKIFKPFVKYDMTAKYKFIATKIIEYINSDKCDSKKLPTERELSQIYGVSRPTVRQALDLLIKENYIYKRQGCGI